MKGTITNPRGDALAFGKDAPVLYVNDRSGYLCERPEVIAQLQAGKMDTLLASLSLGLEKGALVFNAQLMRHELDEAKLLPVLVEQIMRVPEAFVCVDTRNPKIAEECLKLYSPGKALCNFINGEEENLKTLLPIAAKYGGALGTALVDDKGIPDTLPERLRVAKKIIGAAESLGIPREDIAMDAVCLPAGICFGSARLSLETMRAFEEELGVPTLLGVSNVGHMMPNPGVLETVLCILAAGYHLGVAMVDPEMPHFEWMLNSVNFLMGFDESGAGYLEHYRATKKTAARPGA
ncbi:MAG: dihydropteroate synthase [Bacillota bacterium]